MTTSDLPFRATTDEACAWLGAQTGAAWDLASLIAHELTPYVWLDYDAAHAALFGDANGGYAAPIFFADDTARLAAGSADILITMTKDAYKIVTTLPAPGFRRALSDLRFQKKDLERLAAKLKRDAQPVDVKPEVARESQDGIAREQVLHAFGALVRMDLGQALDGAVGLFGDDGARVKGSVKRGKSRALYNPVTLALGLNDGHRVPLSQLRRAFHTDASLASWAQNFEHSLALLGK
jgi:hypothetical protein